MQKQFDPAGIRLNVNSGELECGGYMRTDGRNVNRHGRRRTTPRYNQSGFSQPSLEFVVNERVRNSRNFDREMIRSGQELVYGARMIESTAPELLQRHRLP